MALLGRPECVEHEQVERQGGHLLCQNAHPPVLVAGNRLERIHDDPSEVEVPNHHDVELPEQCEFGEVPRRLAVGLGRLPERPDGPDDREEHRATARHIHEEQDLIPCHPALHEGPCLPNDSGGDVGGDLERDHGHEHLLLPVLQDRLQEGPPRADQRDHREEDDTLHELEEVEGHIPSVRRPRDADVVLVLGGGEAEEQARDEEARHEVVDLVRGHAVAVAGEGEVPPGGQERGVAEGEEAVDGRQGRLADGEVVLGAVGVDVVHLGADGHGDERLRGAVGEEEGVLVGAGDREGLVVVAALHVFEGEELLHVGAVEHAPGAGAGAPIGVLAAAVGRRGALLPRGPPLRLVDGVEEGLVGEEEEPELRVVRPRDGGGDGGARDDDPDPARLGEAEFLEHDGRARVLPEGLLPDLGRHGGRQGSRDGEDEQKKAARRRGHGGSGGRGEICGGGGAGRRMRTK